MNYSIEFSNQARSRRLIELQAVEKWGEQKFSVWMQMGFSSLAL